MATRISPPAIAQTFSTPVVVRTEAWATIIAATFAGPDAGRIDISPDNGVTWVDTKLVFDTNAPVVKLTTPGLYRVVKGTTGGNVAIYAATEFDA